MGWEKILFVLLAVGMVWFMSRMLRGNKEAFTKKNFAKAAKTLGVLAIILIAVVVFCIMMLRQ